jgi:DNA (cytosine-5)-methyltransferase 1
MMMTAISAFAGIGGFDLGLTRAGVRVTAAIEIDDRAQGVLRHHFPATSLFTDIREVTGERLLRTGFDPETGILAGGWPCQGLSAAGLRRGLNDDRSGLFFELVRLAEELRPRWLFFENVPGLLSAGAGQDMGRVLQALVSLGYGISWRILDAQGLGVAQRRRRVLLVGHLGNWTGPEQVLLECQSREWDPAARRAARAQAAAPAPPGAACRSRGYGLSKAAPDVAGPLGANTGGHRYDLDGSGAYVTSVLGPIAHTITAEGHDASEDGTGRGVPVVAYDLAQVTSPHNRANPAPGDPAPPLCATGRPAVAYPVALRGRDGGTQIETGQAEEPAYSPLVTEGLTVRKLTPVECERLQGFPDGWTLISDGKPQPDSSRYRQLGNAVPVPMIEWAARRIVGLEAGEGARAGRGRRLAPAHPDVVGPHPTGDPATVPGSRRS